GIRDRNVTGVQTCALPIFRLGGRHVDGVLRERREDRVEEGVDRGEGEHAAGNPCWAPKPASTTTAASGCPGAADRRQLRIERGQIGRASWRERGAVAGEAA